MQRIYYRKHRRRREARKRLIILILSIVLFILLIVFLRSAFNHFIHPSQSVKSATITRGSSPTSPPKTTNPPPTERTNSPLLSDAVQSALTGTRGNYGILIQNLKTKEFYSSNEHTRYYSASLYKLWVMLTVFEQINNGTLNKDTIMTQDIKILNKKFNIGSESAELTEGSIKMSVGEALEKMIVISDNYSALLLTEKVKLSSINNTLKQKGFYESELGKNDTPPTTTPYDIGLFFEKLYNGQLADKATTNEMIALLKAQRLNDKIPKYLPDNIVVAHKTGELDLYSHDAGIIYTPELEYILVVLSKSDSPDLADVRISNISQEVYSYFSRN